MRAHGVIGIAALTLLVAPAASQPLTESAPPTPTVAINSHAVTANDYPADSLRLQEEGAIALRFLISETGDVSECDVETSSGHLRLDEAACAVVGRWKYDPATKGGKATSQIATANVVFQLVGPPGGFSAFTGLDPSAPIPELDPSMSDPALDLPESYVPPARPEPPAR